MPMLLNYLSSLLAHLLFFSYKTNGFMRWRPDVHYLICSYYSAMQVLDEPSSVHCLT